MTVVMIISIIIIFVVILISVLTTSKAYSYNHTVDSLEDNPHLEKMKEDQNDSEIK